MPAQTIAQVAHQIDHALMSLPVPTHRRLFVLAYVEAGYNEFGERIQRSDELDQRIKTLECEDCRRECGDDCPVKPYRDLVTG